MRGPPCTQSSSGAGCSSKADAGRTSQPRMTAPVVRGCLYFGEPPRQLHLPGRAGQEVRRAAGQGEVDPDRRRRAVDRGAQRVQEPPVR